MIYRVAIKVVMDLPSSLTTDINSKLPNLPRSQIMFYKNTSPQDTHKMTLVAVVLGKCQDKLGKLCATICSKIGPKQVLRHLKS